MKSFLKFIFFIGLVAQFLGISALATDRVDSYPLCKSLDMSSLTAGTKCRTSVDRVFESVYQGRKFGMGWKAPDGNIWSEAFSADSPADARAQCAEMGAILPRLTELNEAKDIGFLETSGLDERKLWVKIINRSGDTRWELGLWGWDSTPYISEECSVFDCDQQGRIAGIFDERISLARCYKRAH